MTRSEKVQQAQALRAEGLTYKEIGAAMGVAISTADAYVNDPDMSKLRARKLSYQGTCIDCGGPTTGGNGPGKAPERCDPCTRIVSRIWTREKVIDGVHAFAHRYGAPPAASDWSVGHPTAEQLARFKRDDCWPPYSAIVRIFGNWNTMIEAAGFEPRASGSGKNRNGSPVAV